MADAIVSVAAERLIALIEEQARHQINLVRGAEEKVRSLAVDLQNIRNVLDGAEIRRFKDNKINYWLSRLEHTASEMEDILDEWDYALLKYQIKERRSKIVASSKQKVFSFIPSSLCFSFKKVVVGHNIGKKILSVKTKLDEILKERDQFGFVISHPVDNPSPTLWRESTSMIDLTEVHGRDRDRDDLVTKLMDSDGIQGESGYRILSIVGVGGLGKTTLAQMVYNHSRVVESFELRIWVCVSDPFDLVDIAKGILENIKVESSPNTNNLEVVFKQVKESISGKKFLLVLDDVWTEDSNQWEVLKNTLRYGGVGSKILVTSRNEMVVKMMGSRESEICRPALLSDEDCWLLLCRMALSERNTLEFEDIGKKIAKKCKGLPLAAKTLGSLLRFKSSTDQWSNVLNNEIWQMEKAEIEIFPHLLLSYNGLSPTLKRCFSYCAIFRKDTEIEVESLIRKWMALGYLGSNVGDMELKGRECFDALAMRSLFQDFDKRDSNQILCCKMHDIVHDFAQFLKKRSKVEAEGIKKACGVCNPSDISRVNEFCTLLWEGETLLPSICDCLVRTRVFEFSRYEGVPHGMGSLIHLRLLSMKYTYKLSSEYLKAIFQLYHLQSLTLSNCFIKEIPKEVENLIQLRYLDLSWNYSLKELPTEIGNLMHLKHLDMSGNESLEVLPESMCALQELLTLNNEGCVSLCKIPESLVHKLSEFSVGIGGSKLELLKNLKRGDLRLMIRLNGDGDLNEVVEDYRKAELRNEIHITRFIIRFTEEEVSSSSSWVWMDVMDALEPHPNLSRLEIYSYGGFKLPRWMGSPLNQLRNLDLLNCYNLTSLPHLGKLPCLESVFLHSMRALEIVGRELLGITGEEGDVVAFPKLKTLELSHCYNWKEWEDITVEEEESTAFSIMPCLTRLTIHWCNGLSMLPHRLLRKMSSLKTLVIRDSTQLEQRYGDKDGSDWKSISINNPRLRLIDTSLFSL